MEKISIVEILKDCPQGMELNCTTFNTKVTYKGIIERIPGYPIVVQTEHGLEFELTQYGQLHNFVGAKCIIYPKGKTTWEGFIPPCKFKDGDVIFTQTDNYAWVSIFKQFSGNSCCTHIDLCINDNDLIIDICRLCDIGDINTQRLATEEEKQKLFQAIKDNGYKWNPETKTLEELPKFKVGDWIVFNGLTLYVKEIVKGFYRTISKGDGIANSYDWGIDNAARLWTIKDAKDGDVIFYDDGWTCIFKCIHGIWYSSYCFITNDGEFHTGYERHAVDAKAHPATKEQCNLLFQKIKEAGYKWNTKTKTLEKLVKDKFDINTLVPFESKVLVRNSDSGFWKPAFWGIYEAEKSNEHQYRNYLTTEGFVRHCIPYNDETNHLVGKTIDCPEYYKTW